MFWRSSSFTTLRFSGTTTGNPTAEGPVTITVGDRVVTEYVGGGLVAQLAAAQAELAREQDRTRREAEAAREREEDAVDAEIDGLGELVEAVAAAHLLASGCHRHKRQWRRKRHG